MFNVTVEAEDRAARREAQALARRDREQQRAGNTGPTAASSTLSGGSRPSRRRPASLGATSAISSGLSIAGPSSRSAPSYASHGPRLPAEEHRHLPPPPEPSTSAARWGLHGPESRSSPSHSSQPAENRPSSSNSSSAGPTTSTGQTPEEMETTAWGCGRCREPDPESSEGLVWWIQCDSWWYHTMCGLGRGAGW